MASCSRAEDLMADLSVTGTHSGRALGVIAVVVAAPELLNRETLAECFSAKAGFALVRCLNSLEEMLSYCQRLVSCVLIVGQEWVDSSDFAEFIRIAQTGSGPRILIFGQGEVESNVRSILRAGCMGYLRSGSSSYLLRRAVRSVAAGEIWASRRVVSQLIQEFLAAKSAGGLSHREREILGLIGEGYKNREIAEELCISPETVRWHLRGLYAKIGVKDRLSAVVYANEHPEPILHAPAVPRQAMKTPLAAI